MSLAASYVGWQGQDCSHGSQGLVLVAGVLRLCPAPITLWPALDWECSPPLLRLPSQLIYPSFPAVMQAA